MGEGTCTTSRASRPRQSRPDPRNPECGTRGQVRGRIRGPIRGGFTLIEAALTTAIVGTGVLALVAAQQAYLQKNDWAQRTGTAMLLANEIRELTLTMPLQDPITGAYGQGPSGNETSVSQYNDVGDFAGVVANGYGSGTTFMDPALIQKQGGTTPQDQPGPINAMRQVIPNMSNWIQQVKVENVLPDNISATYTQPLGTTDLMRITVTVLYQGPNDQQPASVTQLVWVVTK